MSKLNLFRNIWNCLLLVFCLHPSAAFAKTAEWIDEALLHDGRTIEVNRTVIYNFGSGELTYALQRWPNQYSLEATNPDTGKKVKWLGEKYVNPVLLDFVDGATYLVINSGRVFSNTKKYGCPEIPYVFLRYDEKIADWIPIPTNKIPIGLTQANLSESYDGFMNKEHYGVLQTRQQIIGRNGNREKGSLRC